MTAADVAHRALEAWAGQDPEGGARVLGEVFQTLGLGFARGYGAFLVLPLFAAAQFPRQVRNAVPIAMMPALLASMSGARTAAVPEGTLVLLAWLLAELAIGILLTLPVAVLFWAAQSAGELIDIKTGANNNALFGTGADSPVGPAQILMTQLAILVFVAHQGLHEVAAALWRSFSVIPIGQYSEIQVDRLPPLLVGIVEQVLRSTLHIFGPFLVIFLLLEFGLGLMSKFAQQLQISSISAPLKSLMFPLLLLMLIYNPRLLGLPAEWSLSGLGSVLDQVKAR